VFLGKAHKRDCLYLLIPFPCPFSVLAIALFIYFTSVLTGTEARTEVTKKGCGLTRKGHGSEVFECLDW